MSRKSRSLSYGLKIVLLVFGFLPTACSSSAVSSTGTPLSKPLPATVTLTSSPPEANPSPAQSSPTNLVAESETKVTIPTDLHIVYVREGNLWFWKGGKNNVMLTNTSDIATVRLSEGGQLLAFMRGPEVWTVNMDGTDARLLASHQLDGGALWFSPDGNFLAASTGDHIEVLDLKNSTNTTVVTYPTLPNGIYPEIVWSLDSSGFKTVIPPGSENGQAEFKFVFPNGTAASLGKFGMVLASDSLPFISPDGGYVIYVSEVENENKSLFLMDSSGASKPYGGSAEKIRTYGWLPDSKHFVYLAGNREQAFIGNVTHEPDTQMPIDTYETIRWLDQERFLALFEGNLYLADIHGGKYLIAEGVSAFDF